MAEIEEKVRGAYGLINVDEVTTETAVPTETPEPEMAAESPVTDDNDPYLAELKQKEQENA